MNDLLLSLLNEEISTIDAAKEQSEMLNKTEDLKDFILLEEKNATQCIKKQRQKHKENK